MDTDRLWFEIAEQLPDRGCLSASKLWDVGQHRPGWVRVCDFFSGTQQNRICAELAVCLGIEWLKDDLSGLEMLRGLAVEGYAVENGLEVLREEFSKERDFV
jgi:hypothetical protein